MAEGPTDELGRPLGDQEELLGALASGGIDFLVCGGMAVILHGYLRLTVDLDIIPSPHVRNMRALAVVLRDLDAAAVGGAGERLPLDLTNAEGLAVGNYFLVTRYGGLDLLNGPRPDLHRYQRLELRSIAVTVAAHEIRVISKDDLIAMKREAGRPKDLRDIAALTELERNP